METQLIDPRRLKPNPWNSNRVSAENMEKLKRSIRDLGFVTAVVVRQLDDGALQILGGQHRVETAVEMGLDKVPVINVGVISEAKAKRIGLVDNARYGSDDTISLAKIYEEIGMSSSELAEFLPWAQADFDTVSNSVNIDLDSLDDLVVDEDEADKVDVDAVRAPKPPRTHDILRFRVPMGDAERIRQLVEQTMKDEGFQDDDELTSAGTALSFLLLNNAA